MSAPRAARLAAAVALTAAATGGVAVATQAPASAAGCTSGQGVTVVVDHGALGGGVRSTCVSDGAGTSAWDLLSRTYGVVGVQRQPGFICRIGGVPADAGCVNTPPADAYWGLFHSDGTGSWTYSSVGSGALKVGDGGYVAASWQDGGATDQPAFAPTVHRREQKPSRPSPTKAPATSTPTPTTGATPTGTPTADAAPPKAGDAEPQRPRKDTPRKDAPGKGTKKSGDEAGKVGTEKADAPVEDAGPTSAPADPSAQDGGVPTAVTLGVLGALAVAGGGAAVVARRRRGA